jgi:AsmA protein
MRFLIRFFTATLGLVLAAFLLLVAAVLFLFDPNDYRDAVADVVMEQTGRTLEIEGDLSVEVLPCCGIAVEGARLGNREGFADNNFLSVGAVRLGLRVWPLLLRQDVVIGDVSLDGLELTLVRREGGESNWTFDRLKQPAAIAQADPDAEPNAEQQSSALASLTVASLSVRNANISYLDSVTGADYRVEDLNFATNRIRVRQLVNVDTSFRISDKSRETTLQAAVTTKALFDPDSATLTLANVNADIHMTGPDLPSGKLALTIKSDEARFDVSSGSGRIEGVAAALKVAGADLNVTGGGEFSEQATDLSGSLDIAAFSPRQLLVDLGQPALVTSDPAALSSLQGTAQWSVNGDEVALEDVLLRFDQTNMQGNAGVRLQAQPGLHFDFIVDDIDLSRYMAPAVDHGPGGGATPSGEAAPDMPVELIRSLDLAGRARINHLRVSDLSLQNVDAKISAKDGIVSVDPAVAELYGGRYSGKIFLDVTGAQPSAVVDQTLAGIQAGGLLADLAETQNVQGILEAHISAAGVGQSRDQLVRSLAGDVTIDLNEGLYRGVDVWHEIRKARARLKGEAPPPPPAEPQTPITTLAFSGRMDNGVLNTKRMVAEIPFIRLSGNGIVNLVDQNLNYRLNARVFEKPVFADGEDLASLENITIPLTLTGNLASPSVGVDIAELTKQEAVRRAGNLLMEKLGLNEPDPEPDATDESQAGDSTLDVAPEQAEGERSQQDDARDLIRKGLRDIFN